MNAWAASIPRSQVDALILLRDRVDVRMADAGEWLWVRGPEWNLALDRLLRHIPHIRRFHLRADGRLTPVDATLPTESLPDLAWEPLRDRIALRFPRAAVPRATEAGMADSGPADLDAAYSGERLALRLIRDCEPAESDVQSSNLVLTTVVVWCAFVESLPRATWENTDFAADTLGRCVVRAGGTGSSNGAAAFAMGGVAVDATVGTVARATVETARGFQPAWAVRGERWRERDGVATPLGYRWAPAIDSRILRRMWLLSDGDLALWFPDEHVERIEAERFVRSSRSAVRETRRRLLSGDRRPDAGGVS